MFRKKMFVILFVLMVVCQGALFAAEKVAKRPLIGISTGISRNLDWPNYFYTSVSECYVNAVLRAGGVPIVLPVIDDTAAIAEQVKVLDGVIITGGEDINPQMYNEEPHNTLGVIQPRRDVFEKLLLDEAFKEKKPVLGICRGQQFLNVYHGGTLHQDILTSTGGKSYLKHNQENNRLQGTHSVDIKKGSWLSKILEKNVVLVNSFHHQAVKDLAPDFKITAESKDGVIEGIEKVKGSFCVGVQWHPEMMEEQSLEMQKLFKGFIEVCNNK
jgi:putative glutamine amidotransferase